MADIENILKKCKKNANKHDLHSFVADFDGGKVYVNYAYNFNIIVFRFSKNGDIREHYNFNLKEATEFLTKLKLNNISI